MKKLVIATLFNAALIAAYAQNYDVKLIPAELLPHANIVKRMEEIRIEVKDAGRAIVYSKYAVTIMNAGGDEAANFSEPYDKLVGIENIEGNLYDANGKKIKSVKRSDIKDLSGTSDGTLADDNRVKIHNFNWNIYPYTVAYESEVELKGIFYFPRWFPVNGEKIAVEKSKLTVACPLDYKLRFKTFNYKGQPVVSTIKQQQLYEWSVEKLPAIEEEPYEPDWHEITPVVYLAPSDFEIQHYAGNMTDWKGFGKFIYTLNTGRDVLPDNIKLKVHSLTDKLTAPKEKIKVLYEYMQQNTHYISVQLGIGGWQTFDATYVATKGYGDCKALSNYMYSLLKEAGIKSYYTLIKAGDYNTSFLNDFPSNQFNHIILCVPQLKDSVWLECTSQTMPAGYLGGFTSNRYALLIDETGGTLVRTPVYNKMDNLQSRHITASVDAEGKLTALINTSYRAEQQDDLHGMLNAVSKERVSEILKARLNLPSYDITKFEYHDDKGKLPVINEMLQLTANNFCSVSGKRLFISPNILNKSSSKLTNAVARKFDIKLSAAFADIDSVEIAMPPGYTPESTPANVLLDTKFGTYSSAFKISAGKILYVRSLIRNCGNFPASDAVALADFFSKVYSADRSKMVFVKEGL